MDSREAAASIVVVKFAVDLVKHYFPTLRGRWTQGVVLALSVGLGFYAAGVSDVGQLVAAIGAIFAGAIAADQVAKKEV